MTVPTTPNEIESARDEIGFLTRTMLAYIAGVYLLAGAVGNYLFDFLERDKIVWSEFAVMPAVSIGIIVVMSVDLLRVRRAIDRRIAQLEKAPCSKTST